MKGSVTVNGISAAPPILGIDEAWDKVPAGALRDWGYRWVAGYLSPDKTGKNLDADLVHSYLNAGIAVVALFEYGPRGALGAYNQGIKDGSLAGDMMLSLGWPKDSYCYFAVDFDAQPMDMPAISSYLMGCDVAVARRGYHADAYGGYHVIKELFDRRQLRYGFQTYAWSNGQWDSRAVLRQNQNNIMVAGHSVDKDVALTLQFGAWTPLGWIPGGNQGGIMQPDQAKQLADIDWTTTQIQSFIDSTRRVPLHVWCAEINEAITAIERDHADARGTVANILSAVTANGVAIKALADANTQALAALGSATGAEQQLLGIWTRVADAIERLAPPVTPPTTPPAATPLTVVRDSQS